MKTVFLSVLAAFPLLAKAVEVTSLSPSEYADTEVSTNFMFSVGEGGGRRQVFSLELQAAPTNNVEIAIGHDVNGDGHLSLDETTLVVGYDCGDWFVRSAANDSVTYSDVAEMGDSLIVMWSIPHWPMSDSTIP